MDVKKVNKQINYYDALSKDTISPSGIGCCNKEQSQQERQKTRTWRIKARSHEDIKIKERN